MQLLQIELRPGVSAVKVISEINFVSVPYKRFRAIFRAEKRDAPKIILIC